MEWLSFDVLFPLHPVARMPPVMCHCENSKLLCGNLINDAEWEAAEDIPPASVTKHSAKHRIIQHEIGRSFKLSHKREAKLDIRFQRIKCRRIAQFGECRWSNDELHFSVART